MSNKKKLFLIMDINGVLNPYPISPEESRKLLFYSSKGTNIRICPERLKKVRELAKTHDLKIVINPRRFSRLTILDYRDMFKTFGVSPEVVDIVDMTLFGKEEEMAQIFRAQEYLTYHIKKHEDFKLVLYYGDTDLEKKVKFVEAHLPDLYKNLVIVDPLFQLGV